MKQKRMGTSFFLALAAVCLLCAQDIYGKEKEALARTVLPEAEWQLDVTFPDWRGSINSSYAINNRVGFSGYHGQGEIYLSCDEECGAFSIM